MLDKAHYVFKAIIKDGTPVTIRAARTDDRPKIRRAFRNLSRDTVYTRFFGYKSDVSDAELQRITGSDFNREVALLVTIASGDEEVVIGGGSYFQIESDRPARSAEVAFIVEEDYQGLGVASLLMEHIVRIARERDLTRLKADVLLRNLPMLAVFRRSGLPMTLEREGDVAHVTMSLCSARP